ncbi:ABC transporter permease subunit [Actinospica durhamensis]|uniref:ABC transporter permease subunit n=1 Tax=Actinospica durhamensis TaxID=1508375 RepID=A0A941IL03_9ACTN|nr:ABC transporter permease [Actinospica durhamensis]MBR7832440.1 ABC transporter permease subunit [Actinospica durhamensis]
MSQDEVLATATVVVAQTAARTEVQTATPAVAQTGVRTTGPAAAAPSSATPSPWRSVISRIGGTLLVNELRTMFRRNRNLVLLAALAAIPIAIGIAIKVSLRHHGQNAGGFLAQVSNNGLFLVFASLSLTLPIFLPMALGVVAGDSISGEASQGTLRYLLVAPVGRIRLLAVKGVSLVVFCLVSTAVVSLAALLTGLALFPTGPVTLLSGDSISMGAATVKAVWITLLVAASLLGLAALGLFVSTLTDTPIAAMAVATGVTILCGIMQVIPQLSAIQPWLYTAQWPSYADVLRDPVYFSGIEHNLEIQAGYVAVFTLAAWARLTTRDVSS